VTRTICVVTGSRADYGLLRWVMEGIRSDGGMRLQVVATGMHLSPEFGLTYREIEQDGFTIDRKVEMLLSSDTGSGLAKAMGVGLIGFADALEQLRPDIVFVLGDRFEILSAAAAALVARIPVAHAHGGESSEGAFDEAIRHAVTKMAHLHFVAAEPYRARVIQLGEQPDRVFLVGGLGLDSLSRLPLLDRAALENALGGPLLEKSLLVTFHPATLDRQDATAQMAELLAALAPRADTTLLFTMPNADAGGRALIRQLEEFAIGRPNVRVFTSLGQLRYLSCVKRVDAVVGNSSSGLIEAPSLGTPTINIGDRQRGRLRADSVIDCAPDRAAIAAALDQVYAPGFRARLPHVRNPYGDGGASARILTVLREHPLDALLKKSFYALPGAGVTAS
jgi:GDP/UDP-N,N'-diacetylbacillosamine 2-epimerase (hydrolysing)